MLIVLTIGVNRLVEASACEATGALVQGTVGFGLNVVAAPLLVLLDPHYVPAPTLMAGTLTTLGIATRDRRHLDVPSLSWAMAGRVPGTVAGTFVLLVLARRSLGLLFGVLILLGAGLSVLGKGISRRPSNLLWVGMLSGLMGTTASVGGPPLALLYQHEHGSRVRATLSAYGFMGTAVSLIALAAAGKVTSASFDLALTLLPGLIIGYVGSRLLAGRLSQGWFRWAVLAVVAASAVAVIARSIG